MTNLEANQELEIKNAIKKSKLFLDAFEQIDHCKITEDYLIEIGNERYIIILNEDYQIDQIKKLEV